jgi:uncharacterized protein (TIGR03437 family)
MYNLEDTPTTQGEDFTLMLTRLRTAILLLAACAAAFGDTYVAPNSQANTPGNGPINLGSKAKRFQEIVGGGQFTGPIQITGIHLRSAVGTGPVSFNYSSKITLSTTQAFPNTNNGRMLPSLTYANNVGPDATTVYNGSFSGSSPGCSGPAPCPFDIAVPFTTSFSYDPTKGRLLVDIVSSAASGTPTGSLDGVVFPDTTSSTVVVVGGDPTQAAGTLTLGGFVFGLDVGAAAPGITAVENAASNRGFASPLAQGSIFIIKGGGLGPANISIAPAAFQSTTLSGTSVAVLDTVGLTKVNALMYYTSDSQVAALLPSNTPTGNLAFQVTYNGQTSNPVQHVVVPSNVGIFTIDSSGQGPGIVTYADYSLVSAAKAANCGGPNTTCGAANPGDTLILWATGLGPVSGDDASGAGLGQNMPNVPLTLWLGGVKAPVVYQGRSGCCVGEDQIVFTVPNNVPTGCAVPLVVQIGTAAGTISNTTVMPVATASRNCTPNNPALASVNVEQAVIAGPVTFADISLNHFSNGNGPGYHDLAQFQFAKILTYSPGSQPFFASYIDDQPLGACIVYNNLNASNNPPIGNLVNADAGSSFTVKGPNGSLPVTGTPGQFKATLSAAGTFLVPGAYTITGTGGADVGPFSATITFPASPTLVSPQSPNNLTVTRSSGMTVTWTGGDPNGHVEIYISSATDNTFNTGALANCTAAASAGTFTIPPYVLLALPAGNLTYFELGPGTVAAASEAPFTATGLNVGFVQTFIDGTSFGGFALN